MKRIGYLYDLTFTPAALLAAFHAAARHKHGKRACFLFEKHLASNLDTLHSELAEGRYTPRPYYSFMVYEPKPRRIYAPAFRDLVVQHAAYAVVGPIFDRGFIDQSFACRTGKGTHKAADYAQAALQACPAGSYTLKLDIRKFFYRIDRDVLRTLIERKIKDRRFVDLLMQFADHGEPVGIPIGNLLSQLYALIYLNPLDHFIKREIGAKNYCRYVDDFILFGLTRQELIAAKARIVEFITDKLHLELSRFTLATVTRGINFVGYRTWSSKRFIRRHSIYTFRNAVKQGAMDSAVSVLGHARKTHSLQHLLRYFKEHQNGKNHQLPETYRRASHPRTATA
ncbi:reverse transcriptase domain-containing protein [Propionivibrio sp.]|uniref:reverse transcriptase domain-containing protein n=1 Tax=Propionivibrio sp. TaxID=2212460 RepID=UPI003BF26271